MSNSHDAIKKVLTEEERREIIVLAMKARSIYDKEVLELCEKALMGDEAALENISPYLHPEKEG